MEKPYPSIQRHKAAIRRVEPSLPIKCLVRDQLLETCRSFFDFGCGHGEDIRYIKSLGLESDGWDPTHRQEPSHRPADVVNLGYVLNVIEDVEERAKTLHNAWKLCGRVFSIAARISMGGRGNNDVEFGDGILTRIGTFQKYYTQTELRAYIESELQTEAVPAALGVFFVFRDPQLREQYQASRYHRRNAAPRKRLCELRFEKNRALLDPLMESLADRGRLPEADEFDRLDEVVEEFGSTKRAFALIRRVTGEEEWNLIRKKRAEDLLVYLALANFSKRPVLSRLPVGLQRDVRAFFGSYKRACQEADEILFQAGDAESVDGACQRSPVGKLLPNALYLHRSALDDLEPLLRVYEGCARQFIGDIEGANIIKLHRFSGKISYLTYPDFEGKPHPELSRSFKVALRELDIQCYDYATYKNPPILHRKESFLAESHPLHERFARLTRQEEKHGLLEDTSTIGNRDGWAMRLDDKGFTLRGHRLIRATPRQRAEDTLGE